MQLLFGYSAAVGPIRKDLFSMDGEFWYIASFTLCTENSQQRFFYVHVCWFSSLQNDPQNAGKFQRFHAVIIIAQH